MVTHPIWLKAMVHGFSSSQSSTWNPDIFVDYWSMVWGKYLEYMRSKLDKAKRFMKHKVCTTTHHCPHRSAKQTSQGSKTWRSKCPYFHVMTMKHKVGIYYHNIKIGIPNLIPNNIQRSCFPIKLLRQRSFYTHYVNFFGFLLAPLVLVALTRVSTMIWYLCKLLSHLQDTLSPPSH